MWLQDKITTRSKTPKLIPCFINVLIIALFTDSVNRFQENNCKKVVELSMMGDIFFKKPCQGGDCKVFAGYKV